MHEVQGYLQLYSVLKSGWAYLRLDLNEEGAEIPYSREINDKTQEALGIKHLCKLGGQFCCGMTW